MDRRNLNMITVFCFLLMTFYFCFGAIKKTTYEENNCNWDNDINGSCSVLHIQFQNSNFSANALSTNIQVEDAAGLITILRISVDRFDNTIGSEIDLFLQSIPSI